MLWLHEKIQNVHVNEIWPFFSKTIKNKCSARWEHKDLNFCSDVLGDYVFFCNINWVSTLIKWLTFISLTKFQLGSLLRICRKRVGSDKLLIGLFNAFARAAPEDFALQQMDPIVAQLIVVFNNSYNKVNRN